MGDRRAVLGKTTIESEAKRLATLIGLTTVGPHNLLITANHPDTVTQTVSRGSLIYGNSTPAWDELAVGDAGQLLYTDGTDVSWHTLAVADVTDLAYAAPSLTLGTTNAAGSADTVIRTDATILAFDATVPTTIAVGNTAAAGSATVAARRDHRHAITTSSDPGAAASILATDSNGYLQLAGLGVGANCAGTGHITLIDSGTVGNGVLLAFNDTDGDLTLTGGDLHLSEGGDKLKLRRGGDVVNTASDIYADSNLGIAADTAVHIFIDANGDSATAYFAIQKDAETVAGATEVFRVDEAAWMGLNETTNANMTIGLTINQGANDDEACALKSSGDVAHGMTDEAETNTYLAFKKSVSGSGGGRIAGYSEADIGLELRGCGATTDDTRGTAANAAIVLRAWTDDGGTGIAALGADLNLVTIETGNTARFVFDSDGEMHSDAVIGVGDDWDDWDDLALAADLSRLPKAKWDEMMRYGAEDFERAGLLTLSVDEDGQRHAFVKHKALLQFYACCFRAVHQRMKRYERALLGLGADPAALEA